ncbi:NAD(P)H-dependent glycerol-3-phosphate dehydrogenase [Pontibacter sp. G13]|uniref:NAD(P)H-dependent glycerol-3-phosphate dehydrogenase n=1 Tax=Pontibacter sp. G13 TaxID=3074898 RepID=UPI00288929FC|nr:NAD(P)H-dependent glycerol-3-phosphate dehydrogenase [Pontibacter sp. G13]WNJ21050.1 NAD(P)H-dependent glycerol-3-phosphate dehydrogenase [Pontibacter sp. G13]
MNSSDTSSQTVGVIGAGSFGTAMANLLSANRPVLLYARRAEVAEEIMETRRYKGRVFNDNIRVTQYLEEIAQECELIFPVVPSQNFRTMIQNLSPFLRPYHKIIHGTKGLDVQIPEGKSLQEVEILSRSEVKTMSEVILEETIALRVGCVAGPNLAKEIAEGQPAATVVASHFDEVIREGQNALRSSNFRVHGNHDLFGIELTGVLKNIMAIASGISEGLGYGHNTRAMLITRGLAEMIYIGQAMGANVKAFLGMAGIGDLVATCSSPNSRNFSVGFRLAQGETLGEIIESMDEVAEGVNTISIIRALSNHFRITAPISVTLYKILFEGMEIDRGMRLLMEFPFTEDVEFI